MNALIVDDHPLVCSGIKGILSSGLEFDAIKEANDINTALKLMDEFVFNITLVDVRLKDESGIDFINIAKPRYPECRYLVLSSSSRGLDFNKAVQAGADGYILKDAFPEDIIYAVNTILRGRKYYDPVFIAERNGGSNKGLDGSSMFESLSPREIEIMECLAKGMSNRDISKRLYISENTVKKHISSILSKLGLKDRTQAALYMSRELNNRK